MSDEKPKLTHLTGNAGNDPTTYETTKGDVTKISLGVTLRYGGQDGENETRWVNLAIWNEDLQEFAKREISKGSNIAVVGVLKSDREYNGKQQFDLSVSRIGLISWAKRSKDGQSSKPKAKQEPAGSEELGW